VVGTDPEPLIWAGTTDARYVREPVVCYGPLAGNKHGVDEWVDLETTRRTAVVVAATAARWCAGT
jgi:acetylornithine deacetylase